MPPLDGAAVERAVGSVLAALTPHADRDWSVPAGKLTWSCWTTAAHLAHDLLAYAGQVAGRSADRYLPFDLVIHPDAPPEEVLRVVAACGGLLSSAITAAPPDTRAWHWGPADPAAFAAMGIVEALVHGSDICRGLGVSWRPPADLAAAALARLMPAAPAGPAEEVLLWATGRIPLGDRPPAESWVYKAAL